MNRLRLILLATCAFSMSQFAHAEPSPSFLMAQAAPDQQKAPEGRTPPKAPPQAAPRPAPPAPPKAAPPPPPRTAPPQAPKAAPPHPPAAPQAPAARPAPPPPAPHAAPPPQAHPPGAPARPTPPAAAPQPPHRGEAPRPQQPPTPQQPPAPRGEAPRAPNAQPVAPGVRDVTPQRAPVAPNAAPAPAAPPNARPNAIQTPPGGHPLPNGAPPAPNAAPNAAPGAPGANGPRTERRGPPPGLPAGTPAAPARAPIAAPLPPAPAAATTPLPARDATTQRGRIEDFRGKRQERTEGGRTIITEPGRVIVRDPNGQSFVRHNDVDRFRYGARDVRVDRQGNDTRTVVVRPDGTQIITINDERGGLLRRSRRGPDGREVVIIDNRRHGGPGFGAGLAAGMVAGAIGGYFVSLPPPVLHIPQDRYIVEADSAPPDLIYDTLIAPPVDRIERPYSLDEIRYSPSVRQRMPSIDLDTINFETGSWDIPPDQAAKLQVIADGMNRAIQRNPQTVFLIEGHTDAVGNDVDNLSLSDRRAEAAAELLTQQFGVPAENLTSQGYGEQYLKIPTDAPERRNRRVTVRNITPLLNGGEANAAPR
nr:OmpA family protein [[Pseudomonas] carboxydohydrogena]